MTGESRRTPITVANDSPLRELVRHGSCVTFRSPDRSTGSVWGRTSRTSAKKFNAHLKRVVDVDSVESLSEELVEKSGFEDRDEWVEAIEELHGTVEGSVYRLTIDEWTVDEPEALLPDGDAGEPDAGEATDAGEPDAGEATDDGDGELVTDGGEDTVDGAVPEEYKKKLSPLRECLANGEIEGNPYEITRARDAVFVEFGGNGDGGDGLDRYTYSFESLLQTAWRVHNSDDDDDREGGEDDDREGGEDDDPEIRTDGGREIVPDGGQPAGHGMTFKSDDPDGQLLPVVDEFDPSDGTVCATVQTGELVGVLENVDRQCVDLAVRDDSRSVLLGTHDHCNGRDGCEVCTGDDPDAEEDHISPRTSSALVVSNMIHCGGCSWVSVHRRQLLEAARQCPRKELHLRLVGEKHPAVVGTPNGDWWCLPRFHPGREDEFGDGRDEPDVPHRRFVVREHSNDTDYPNGLGVEFPSGTVVVEWVVEAWPPEERLDGPHQSVYDSVDDLQQVVEGTIYYLEDRPAEEIVPDGGREIVPDGGDANPVRRHRTSCKWRLDRHGELVMRGRGTVHLDSAELRDGYEFSVLQDRLSESIDDWGAYVICSEWGVPSEGTYCGMAVGDVDHKMVEQHCPDVVAVPLLRSGEFDPKSVGIQTDQYRVVDARSGEVIGTRQGLAEARGLHEKCSVDRDHDVDLVPPGERWEEGEG